MSSFRGWSGRSYRIGGGGGHPFGGFTTPLVKQLIYLNCAVFGVQLLAELFWKPAAAGLVLYLGLVPDAVLHGFLWQPLTYLFLHGGVWHLIFNLLALWMFGCELERAWGRQRFLAYYLLCGAGAGVFNVLVKVVFGGAGDIPTIGASGAIYAILLAYGLLWPHRLIYLWFIFPIPARIFVLIIGVVTFLSALEAPGDRVSHIAHLGGMLFGLVWLRGGWLFFALRGRWLDWRYRRLRRDFQVFMRQHEAEPPVFPADAADEDSDPDPDRPAPPRWIN